MILMDSNIIIYVTSGQYPELTSWFLDNAPSASAVSKGEVLGYHNLKSAEKAELERFFSRLNVIYPTAEEFDRAVALRIGPCHAQQKRFRVDQVSRSH